MLIDREVMVHIELHHRDHAAEFRNEAAKHARIVHAPQNRVRVRRSVVSRSRNKRLASGSSRSLSSISRSELAQQAHGVWVQQPAGALGLLEKADQVDRIAAEHIRIRDVEPVVIDPEIGLLADVAARLPASAD